MGKLLCGLGAVVLASMPIVAQPVFAQTQTPKAALEEAIGDVDALEMREFPNARALPTTYFNYVLTEGRDAQAFKKARERAVPLLPVPVKRQEVKNVSIISEDRGISVGDTLALYDARGIVLGSCPLAAGEPELLSQYFSNLEPRRYSVIEPRSVAMIMADGMIRYYIQANLEGIADKAWWVMYRDNQNRMLNRSKLEWNRATTRAASEGRSPTYVFSQRQLDAPPGGAYIVSFEVRDFLQTTFSAYVISADLPVQLPKPKMEKSR